MLQVRPLAAVEALMLDRQQRYDKVIQRLEEQRRRNRLGARGSRLEAIDLARGGAVTNG